MTIHPIQPFLPKIWSDILNGNIYPTFRPDLATSDFHLFRLLKKFLDGKHFATDDEVKEAVEDWVIQAHFYDLGILKPVRYEKYLIENGSYVET